MKKNVILTNGCFDILHLGHVKLLKYAKSIAPYLIVLLNSDDSIRKLEKGIDRPINNQKERYEVLKSIRFVDEVIIFEEKTPLKIIEEIKPQFYLKGGDYKIEDLSEAEIVKGYGGKVYLFSHTGHSTTSLINKIRC